MGFFPFCRSRNGCDYIRCALPYVLLAACVFAAYANVYSNAFLYDDHSLIVQNDFLRSWGHLPSALLSSTTAGSIGETAYYRPLQILLYMVTFQIAGLSLFAFHFLNVILHAVNAALVYTLGNKLGFRAGASFLAAALWALHPLNTEAVTYMSATADPLYSFFCLWGVLLLLPDFSHRRIWTAMPLMALALFSKEAAIVFPLLAMACYYLKTDRRLDPKTYVRFWPLMGLSVAYMVLRLFLLPQAAGGEGSDNAPSTIIYGGIAALPHYARLMLIPIKLHMGYDLPFRESLWHADLLVGLSLFIAASIYLLRTQTPRSLPFSWGLCWFAAALFPSLSSNTIFYEHWLYLPMAGLFLGLAQTLALFMDRLQPSMNELKLAKKAFPSLALMACVWLALATHVQNRVWRDPVAFYENIIANEERAANAHNNLGALYSNRGDYEKAIDEFRAAIENSGDTLAEAQRNVGQTMLLIKDGKSRVEEASKHLLRALSIQPTYYPALHSLALLYAEQGDADKAAFYRQKEDQLRQRLQDPFASASAK